MDTAGVGSMSLAMKRLQNIGWLALVFLVAIMLYPWSLHVASVHSDLVAVDKKIRETKREISFLNAELRTRASLQQLDEWNELLYGYEPPTAEQFLSGENALAQLDNDTILVKPVMVSSMDQVGVAPAGVIGSPTAKMENTVQVASNQEQDSKQSAPVTEKKKEIKVAMAEVRESPDKPSSPVITERTQKLASIDKKLLSDDLMSDLKKKSEKERKRK
jgi:hypothetical protein